MVIELLVSKVDRLSGSVEGDAQSIQSWEVIHWQPADTAVWGARELSNPHWVIWRVDMLGTEADMLVTSETDINGDKPYCYVKQHKINRGALTAPAHARGGIANSNTIEERDGTEVLANVIHKGVASGN